MDFEDQIQNQERGHKEASESVESSANEKPVDSTIVEGIGNVSTTNSIEGKAFKDNNIIQGHGNAIIQKLTLQLLKEGSYEEDLTSSKPSGNGRTGLPKTFYPDPDFQEYPIYEEVEKYKEQLKNSSLVIINCPFAGIVNTISQLIVQDEEFIGFDLQELSLNEYDNSTINALATDIEDETITAQKDKLLLFVWAQNDGAFFSENKWDQFGTNRLKGILKERQVKLVIFSAFSSEGFDVLSSNVCIKSYLLQQECLKPFLEYHGKSNRVYELINEQVSKGLWPQNESELLTELSKVIEEKGFDQLIENKTAKSKWEDDFSRIIEANPVHRYVLYVAAFFPRLEITLFRDLVTTLLEKGQVKPLSISKEKGHQLSWVDEWSIHDDQILDACKLQSFEVEDRQLVIDFGIYYDANECQRLMLRKQTNFVDRQFRVLTDEGIFQDLNTSIGLLEKLDDLVVKMFDYFKSYFGSRFLFEQFDIIQSKKDKVERIQEKIVQLRQLAQDTSDPIKQLNEEKIHAALRLHVLTLRFTNLLGKLMQHTRSGVVVNNMIEKAAENIRRNTAITDVLSYLYSRHGFDSLASYKKILDSNSRTSRELAFEGVLNILFRQQGDINELIGKVVSWCSITDEEFDKLSGSEQYTYAILFVYLQNSCNSRKMLRNSINGRHPMLYLGNQTTTAKGNTLQQVLNLLFDENLFKAVKMVLQNTDQLDKVIDENIARERLHIIESWLQVLVLSEQGKAGQLIDPEQLVEMLEVTIKDKQLSWLTRKLKTQISNYNALINKTDNKEFKEDYRQKREVIRQFINITNVKK